MRSFRVVFCRGSSVAEKPLSLLHSIFRTSFRKDLSPLIARDKEGGAQKGLYGGICEALSYEDVCPWSGGRRVISGEI